MPRQRDEEGWSYGVNWDWDEGFPQDSRDWARVSWNLPKTRVDAARLALEHWTNVIETYDPDSIDPLAWARGISAAMPAGTGFWRGSEQFLSDHTYPLDAAFDSARRSVATREVLKSSLGVLLAIRNKSNDPFAKLGIDPWTGTSLLFKKTTDGFKVYSVGRNGIDDGGVWGGVEDTVFKHPLKRGPAPPDFYSN